MFKTFAQIALSVLVSLGLVAGPNPEVREKLVHALERAETAAVQTMERAAGTIDRLADRVRPEGSLRFQAEASGEGSFSADTQEAGTFTGEGNARADTEAQAGFEAGQDSWLQALFAGTAGASLSLGK